MKRHGDIEGVLEAWFLDGPMEMPDRLFDAVFDQVERVPQRRLARLKLRFSDMSPTARLLVAAGATILVLGLGVAAVGAIRSTPSTAPTMPTPSASPSDALGEPVAAELRYQFVGSHRSEPPAPAGTDRSIIGFTEGEFTYNGSRMTSQASSPSADSVVLRSDGSAGCAEGTEGEYTWSASPGSTKVTFTLVRDACDARAAVIPGDWLRADCPDPESLCLGPLEADSYSSQFIDPWVGPGDAWRPRFGAITYEVPAGWENVADYPTEYKLARQDAPPDTGIFVFSEAWPITQDDPCLFAPDATVGRSSSDMVAYLEGLAGLASAEAQAVVIGALSGYRIDLSMDPAWAGTCSFSEGQPVRPLYGDGDPSDGLAWGIAEGGHTRSWFLDLEDNRSLLISAEAPDATTFSGMVDEATAIVESMVFTPPE